MEVKNVTSVFKMGMSLTKAKKKDILSKSLNKCSHCGKELSAKDFLGLHDIIAYNVGGDGSLRTVVAVCEDCEKETDGFTQPIEYYKYLTEESKEELIKEKEKYDEKIDWFEENNLFPVGDLELEDKTKLERLYKEENLEEVTEFFETYNKYVKLALYGEEDLVNKIFKDGRFYAVRGIDNKIDIIIPIKPIKNPKGYMLNVGNIMVNPDISEDDDRVKLIKPALMKVLECITVGGKEPMISSVVVACNSRDSRIVPIVKSLDSINYKIAKIRPGYSLAQSYLEMPNVAYAKEYEENKLKRGELDKKAKKSFNKLARLYIESLGGVIYEAYIADGYRGKKER